MPRNEKHYFICQQCNKEFYDSKNAYRKPRFCCKECRIKSNRIEKNCRFCNKPFTVIKHKKDKQFCNQKCHYAFEKSKRIEITCNECGKEFKVPKGQKDRQYCSRKCRDKGVVDNSKRDTFTCEWCGKQFESWVYRPNRFCSRQCNSEFGARQPKLKARKPESFVTLTCVECGKPYTVHKSQTEGRNSRFCSVECRGNRRSQDIMGKNNPLWQGGSDPSLYGPNWGAIARRVRERDNHTCQVCGYQDSKRNLDVHHIKPLRTFNGDHISANHFSNLISLCRSCHKYVEHGKIPCPTPKGV